MATHRKFTIAVGVLLFAVVFALGALYSWFSPDRLRSDVISFLQTKTRKQIEIGNVQVHWISGSIRVYGVGIKNPAPFPKGYVFKASRVDAVIDVASLLKRKIVIESVILYQPVINVISDPDGLWNFENSSDKSASVSAPNALGTIPKVTIEKGKIFGSSLVDPSDRPGPIVFEVDGLSASLTNVNFDAFAAEQSSPVASGDIEARSLRLGSIVVTRVEAKLRLFGRQVVFAPVTVDADGGQATGELRFDLTGKDASFKTRAQLSRIDVAQLLSNFPGGSGIMTGTMHGEVTVAGPILHTLTPLAGISANGRFEVIDGELPGLNSNESLKSMTRFRNPQDARRAVSAFSSFSSDLDLTNEQMTNHDIDVDFYGVDFECSGYLKLNGSNRLNYKGLAKVLKKQGFFTNTFAKLFHEAREHNGKLVFPLQITGTLADPKLALVD